MANKGGKREGAGRKPKSEEQQLIQKLTPLEPIAFEALKQGLLNPKAHSWAVPLFFGYKFGKPTQKIEAKVDSNPKIIIQDVAKNNDA